MKSLCAILACSLSLFVLSSCDSSEEEQKPDNHIVFNGVKFPINHARLSHQDDADLRFQDPNIGTTHYVQSMRFTDGELDPANDFYIQNGSYKLTFSVYRTMADHAAVFTGGTFASVHPQDVFGSKAPLDEDFYTFFILRHDDNGNGVFEATETWYDGLAGQVVIYGSGESFTVTINTSDPAKSTTTTGAYKGPFEIVN
jgi:hypothetical protein